MFLNQLKLNEKEVFWNVANILARVDGQFTAEEEEMLEQYNLEMQTDFVYDGTKTDKKALLQMLQDSSRQAKKMIYFELYGLVYADKKYSADEKEMMQEVQKILMLSDADVKELGECVIAILDIYKKLGGILAR